ncbi:Cytochrome C oxidase subunit IV [Nitrobacter sp. Nb-311A]|uniref:cytochrome o ubiquinol oxidase subunit IV n=1 Tax=unclassified Nitrobacter TaxID=2620411 RepID=UPI000068744C|nr:MULTISPECIES: cytochrome o ubiquinol oxidase subunit IV [unclassified Nitrobacter]EAQ33977.1 Cytochrome C oxidase subunit IV [Nitrobacter sp. Nb-311A]MCV0388037.1 cytochrome o ubiquinol oxidase subunit IV [Nitrobacter sp.]
MLKSYLVGVLLASVLTAIPFGFVATRTLPPGQTLIVIGVAAVAQVVVHLRYFLRLDLKSRSQDKFIALCFAATVLFILVGGTLWIMFDRLPYRVVGDATTIS